MKKFLLSMVALLGMGLAASAADVTITSSDFNQSTLTATKGGFTVTLAKENGSTAPAFRDNGSIRLYAKGTITISGGDLTNVVIALASDAGFRYTTVTANTGTVAAQAENDTEVKWTGNTTKLVLTVGDFATLGSDGASKAGQLRFTEITISGEGGSDPDPDPDPQPTGKKYEMVNALTTGSYVFVVNEDGTYKLGTPAAATVNYGRISLVAATVENNTVNTDAANAFTITVNGDKATIQDANGRYYGMDDSHFTSFQFYTEHNEGCDYTFAFEGNNVKFTNALNTNCIIAQSKGTQGTWYANVAPAKEPTEFNLPILFKESKSDGIADITVDENAPVEYFNLQGVRVANPENGLYIRRQGNKATKVLVK
ncbi:MAG: hypothetical protein J6J20_02060 [Muribaculaceae bacterium]|nr:hypothetical protein [Muribaculaceae bacterium]